MPAKLIFELSQTATALDSRTAVARIRELCMMMGPLNPGSRPGLYSIAVYDGCRFDDTSKNVCIPFDQRIGDPLPRGDGVDRKIVFGEPFQSDQQRPAFVALGDPGDRIAGGHLDTLYGVVAKDPDDIDVPRGGFFAISGRKFLCS
jgi:hypothetical protein